ncbi:MAG: cytochrome d ubiquinol oxidase subunit II [Ktedonobacteraceae bacterium]|nr:cytochrome d ubiquinol oxidase subunit II [Ktedonobacteraceae bacterium]
MSVALIALVVLWWGLIAYAVLGGADFGAGVWDLFAIGKQAERQRKLINHAIGPVWEANHTWLIFLVVGLFNVFPSAFAALFTALFVPFSIVLIGIVLRGAAFIFSYYAVNVQGPFARWWGRTFSVTSLITPFFLGASAAAVASGKLLAPDGTARADLFASWTSPFALTIGAMAVVLCATLAAVYLTVEARNDKDEELAEHFRLRALVAGAVTAVLGALGLFFSINDAPTLWSGMLAHALPVVIATMIIGLATAVMLFRKQYRLARILIIAEAAFLLSSWGLSQYPYIIPPHLTIDNAANAPNVIITLLIGIGIGLVILLPSLYYLFSVFKLSSPAPGLKRQK